MTQPPTPAETSLQANPSDVSPTALLHNMLAAAVRTALPEHCLPPHLPAPPADGRLFLLGAGKSAGAMAAVAEAHYRETCGAEIFATDATSTAAGQIVTSITTRHGYTRPTRHFTVREAGHPVPDAGSIEGAREALALAAMAGPADRVVVLMSGGASALWSAPAPGLELTDKQAVTQALLKAGHPISVINTVRKHLSAIKGGRLAAAAAPASVLTLAISDVPGDDPATIGSGPTVGDYTTVDEARRALATLDGRLSAQTLERVLAALSETPEPGDAALAGSAFRLIATPAKGLEAAAEVAREAHYSPILLGSDLEGEARDLAKAQALEAVSRAGNIPHEAHGIVFLSGGELTVTVTGNGRGGPNQEYALALALALDGRPDIHALAADTDGSDGGTGAADDPAGAIVSPDTLARAASAGIDPGAMLANNDATGFFAAVDQLVKTGPTFTNINDFRAIVVSRT